MATRVLQIRIPIEDWEQIQGAATIDGISMSEWVRRRIILVEPTLTELVGKTFRAASELPERGVQERERLNRVAEEDRTRGSPREREEKAAAKRERKGRGASVRGRVSVAGGDGGASGQDESLVVEEPGVHQGLDQSLWARSQRAGQSSRDSGTGVRCTRHKVMNCGRCEGLDW